MINRFRWCTCVQQAEENAPFFKLVQSSFPIFPAVLGSDYFSYRSLLLQSVLHYESLNHHIHLFILWTHDLWRILVFLTKGICRRPLHPSLFGQSHGVANSVHVPVTAGEKCHWFKWLNTGLQLSNNVFSINNLL